MVLEAAVELIKIGGGGLRARVGCEQAGEHLTHTD